MRRYFKGWRGDVVAVLEQAGDYFVFSNLIFWRL